MALTARQRASRLAQIRRIIMRMYPVQPSEPVAIVEGEDVDREEPDDLDARPALDAPIVDMVALPPRAIDASLPW